MIGTTSKHRRWVVPVAVALLLTSTAGCGARWDDDELAAVQDRYTGGGSGGAGSSGSSASAAGSSGSSGSSSAASSGSSAGAGASGSSGAATAGAGDGAAGGDGGAVASALPCSAASDAPGVTDSTITLGTISSLSGPVPGLGQSALDAVQAYVDYRNSVGGVCGRQLALRSADDGTDTGRHRALVQDLDSDIIGLVGGLGGGDAGSGDTVAELGMPVIAGAISEQFQDSPAVFDTNPPFADVNAVIGKFRYYHDAGVRTAAVVYLGVDQTRSEILDKQVPQMEAAGIDVVMQLELPLSTLSYDSAARQVANSGADYLLFLADYTQSASMARAMTDTGYQLDFAEYVTAYGPGFLDLAGAGGEGAISWIRNLPNEDGGANPEQALFLQWMAQSAPDTQPDTFAADSWVAAKAMVEAMEALPGPITRDSLMSQIRSVHSFDADGFFGNIDLGGKLSNGCFVAMKVVSGQWTRLTPADGFIC